MSMDNTEKKDVICTCCPVGCHMEATLENGAVTAVTGNSCKRGEAYAKDECTNPKRTLTTTVRTADGEMLSVKTASPIPIGKISEAVEALAALCPPTPIAIGDVVCENICETGISVVATKNLP